MRCMSGVGGFYSFVANSIVWSVDGASAPGAMVRKMHFIFCLAKNTLLGPKNRNFLLLSAFSPAVQMSLNPMPVF